MWSRMVYQNIQTYYLPMIEKWSTLHEGVYLPVYITRHSDNLVVCSDAITEDMCAEMYFLYRDGIESFCMFCENSITCSINMREKGMKFTPDEDMNRMSWDGKLLKLLKLIKSTTEVPFLVLYEDLAKKLSGKPFEIEFVGEIYNIAFDKYRILRNIDILLATDIKLLKRYQTIVEYASDETLKSKLKELRDKISSFTEKQFNKAIARMKL